jgi:hypothetical protein
MTIDEVLTIINVILTGITGYGAYKANKAYQKSKILNIYTHSNKALIEVQKMLTTLPGALNAVKRSGAKGHNGLKQLQEVGNVLNESLNEVMKNISSSSYTKINEFIVKEGFDIRQYINSYISGDAYDELAESNEKYSLFQSRLLEMQNYFINEIEHIGDKINE